MDIEQWEAYDLAEAAAKTGKTENDLLRMAAKGALPLWVWIDPIVKLEAGHYEGWAVVPADVLGGLLVYPGEKYGVLVSQLTGTDGRPLVFCVATAGRRIRSAGIDEYGLPLPTPEPPPTKLVPSPTRLFRKFLRVLPDDLQRLLEGGRVVASMAVDSTSSKVLVQWGPIAGHLRVSVKTAMRWGKENSGGWLRWTDKGHPTTTTAELDILLHGKGKASG